MTDSERVLLELTPIFREVLGNRELVLSPLLTAKDVDGWDSFSHIKLIAAIEEHFHLKFRLKQIVKFRNIGDVCGAILESRS